MYTTQISLMLQCIFPVLLARETGLMYVNTWVNRTVQYIPRNIHTVFVLLCFVVVIYWLIFPYPPGLLRWHCGNLTIAPVPAKQPWWIWINTRCEIIMNDYITTTKLSTTKPCAYLLGYTVSGTRTRMAHYVILPVWLMAAILQIRNDWLWVK